MEEVAVQARMCPSVGTVAHQWVSQRRKVYPDLVGTPGFRHYLHQRILIIISGHLISCDCLPAVGNHCDSLSVPRVASQRSLYNRLVGDSLPSTKAM